MLHQHDLGLYEKALNPALSWLDRLSTAKSLGFDFVEISIDESDERLARLDWSPAERAALHPGKRRAAALHVPFCSPPFSLRQRRPRHPRPRL